MNVNEFAAKYKTHPSEKVLQQAARALLTECRELLLSRKVSTNEGMFIVLDEIDAKWRRFVVATEDPQVNPAGMMLMIEYKLKFVYPLWLDHRKRKILKKMDR